MHLRKRDGAWYLWGKVIRIGGVYVYVSSDGGNKLAAHLSILSFFLG